MSKRHTFSFFFILFALLMMALPSLCFGDSCNYSKLVDADGNYVMVDSDAGCAPDCPEDTVIRYNLFTHKFSCDSNSDKRFDSIVVKKLSPSVKTSTYSY